MFLHCMPRTLPLLTGKQINKLISANCPRCEEASTIPCKICCASATCRALFALYCPESC